MTRGIQTALTSLIFERLGDRIVLGLSLKFSQICIPNRSMWATCARFKLKVNSRPRESWRAHASGTFDLFLDRWALWSDVDYSRPREVLMIVQLTFFQGLAVLHDIRYLDLMEHQRALRGRCTIQLVNAVKLSNSFLEVFLRMHYRNGPQVHPFDVARLFNSLVLAPFERFNS